MDAIESRLRTYYETESERRLRPAHDDHRRGLREEFADRLVERGCRSVVDVGAGPGGDQASFAAREIAYVGVDLALGNARIAAETERSVIPASLFELPFPVASFSAGWSMSTFQHVPDDRIDVARAEFVRVLEPGASVIIGLWGGRDEVIDRAWAKSPVQLPRHFTLRTHEHIETIISRHFLDESHEVVSAGPLDWDYHVVRARTPT